MQRKYSWKRFWCPRTAEINLSDGGFLTDPDAEYGSIYNPNIVPFSKFRETLFLGLLGEPGIGKSFALQEEVEATKTYVEKYGGEVLYLNLRSIGSEDRLERKLFLSSEFKKWKEQQSPLYVFLDSLDECLISIPKVSNILIDELKELSPENLFIRIACRTIDWPISLENAVKGIYPENEVKVFELVPLRRTDVISAILNNEIDPERFIEEVFSRDVVPFAIKPLTLNLLMNVFLKNGGLPQSKSELYRQALLALCEEQNQERRDAGLRGNLTRVQRLAVAARIAALTIFCGKNAVWVGPEQGEVPENDLCLSEIVGGVETVSGSAFEINEDAIRETLGTGLFSSRGPHRMGWSHQTYAEYLAASYVFVHSMAIGQVVSLFCNPEGSDNKIIPQLVPTASWGASTSPEFFQALIKLDPEVLLYCDFSVVPEADKAQLLESLLYLYDQGEIFDSNWSIKDKYSDLAHPEIEGQLKAYIIDMAKGVVVRRVAIDIIDECSLDGLTPDLLKITLNLDENQIIRKKAIRAIRHIGNEEKIIELRPLLGSDFSLDQDDELKAEILKTLWPNHVGLKDVLKLLTPPKKENFIGAYFNFIKEEFAAGIQIGDVEQVLEWIVTIPIERKRGYLHEKLVRSVLRRAIDFIDDKKCLQALTHCYLELQVKHLLVFDEDEKSISDDQNLKFSFGIGVLREISENQKYTENVYYLRGNLFGTDDVPRLLCQFSEENTEPFNKSLAILIRYLFGYEQSDLIITESQKNQILSDEFKFLLQPVILGSAEAEEIKKRYYAHSEGRKPLDPPPLVRMLECLDAIEEGKPDLWPSLLLNMTLEEDSTSYDWPNKDVWEMSGWQFSESDIRSKVLKAAESYLVDGTPKMDTLYEQTTQLDAVVAEHAFRLLKKGAPAVYENLSEAIWKKWAKIFFYSARNDDGVGIEFLKRAYNFAPFEIRDTAKEIIQKENDGPLFYLRVIENIWDGAISRLLFEEITKDGLSQGALSDLLNLLLANHSGGAREFAETLIPRPIPSEEDGNNSLLLALIAGEALLCHESDYGWPILWPLIQKNKEFGRKLFARVSSREGIVDRLTDDQASDLYVWLTQEYPYIDELDDKVIGPEDFRDSILRHLKSRGTDSSCTAIEKIAKALPQEQWLNYTIYEAKKNARRSNWCPPKPKSIIELSVNREASLVRSSEELLEVILASLDRLESKLHGETPLVRFLWNGSRPKNENDFSDFVKSHLKDDLNRRGIIANREVEFRRLSDAGVGEKTDIVVDAVSPAGTGFEPVTVVIESKGCWNKELMTAMKDQLIGRYLIDPNHRHGIYLVGWFLCDKWASGDYKKSNTPKMTIDELKTFLRDQAGQYSGDKITVSSFVMNTRLSS